MAGSSGMQTMAGAIGKGATSGAKQKNKNKNKGGSSAANGGDQGNASRQARVVKFDIHSCYHTTLVPTDHIIPG